ncbi:MAG: hypothetical protein NVSMB56_06250 [Pyrinomonadaceae bacterium]
MYRVFLSYNTSPDEMVVVWRLQTLAAASGLHLDVPNPAQRANWIIITQMIDAADAVIVFLIKTASAQVKKELHYSLDRQKRVVPIVEQGISTKSINTLLRQLKTPVFYLDSNQPGKMESDLAQFLKSEHTNKNVGNAILAVAGMFAGLYLLQELTKG